VSLDELLDEWGARSRLTAREAETVRTAVVAARQPGLDAGWWNDLMGQVSATVIQATVLPDGARLALQPGWSGA
jgi:hypothetical protein